MQGRFLLIAAPALLALAFATPAFGGRIVVDNDLADCPNADTSSIQAGVALAGPGDTVFVCAGTHSEQVVVSGPAKDNIRVVGAEVNETILDGNNALLRGFSLVNVSGVELRRFTVRGYQDAGIVLVNSDAGNVVAENVARNNVGFAVPFANGIRNENTPGTVITHNLVTENGHHGLRVTGSLSTGLRIEHNVALLNGTLNDDDGIRLDTGPAMNIVAHNISERNRHDGIHLIGVHFNLVEHNDLIHNGTPGAGNGCGSDVEVGSSNNVLQYNFATAHDRAGIRLRGAGVGNVVAHNELFENGRAGIRNETTTGTVIEFNHIEHSFGFAPELGTGIHILNAAGLTVRDNQSDLNTGDGILLENGDTSDILGNHANENGRDGIRADVASSGNAFLGNHLFGNAEHDAHDNNRAANTWSGNHCATGFPAGTICGV